MNLLLHFFPKVSLMHFKSLTSNVLYESWSISSGFSVNKGSILGNQSESSIVSQRIIQVHLKSNNVTSANIVFTIDILQSDRAAWTRYEESSLGNYRQQKWKDLNCKTLSTISMKLKGRSLVYQKLQII